MPIGASKVGALGGLVPGGSETFNASGTFTVPPGVKKVNITGKGGTGNPGNAGNQGNPGNPGTGGAGSGGGNGKTTPVGCFTGTYPGGHAWFTNAQCQRFFKSCNQPIQTFAKQGGNGACQNVNSQAGQTGNSGNAGTAGNPGNPGNTGCSSSALCNTFPGGAGGNAGVAGAAGNGGTGGTGGGPVTRRTPSTTDNTTIAGGTGGNGGGTGGTGNIMPFQNLTGGTWNASGAGGAGAGSVNSGQGGANSRHVTNICTDPSAKHAVGGTSNVSGPLVGTPTSPYWNTPNIMAGQASINTMGGTGGGGEPQPQTGSPSVNLFIPNPVSQNLYDANNVPTATGRLTINNINPVPDRPDVFRAGAGGGYGGRTFDANNSTNLVFRAGGGGGGGGRGNAGNPGGPTPTPSGQAATPLTFNCVSVTPGSPYPVTVASPGGQIVISWNPQ